jgi:mgtE-like transporter
MEEDRGGISQPIARGLQGLSLMLRDQAINARQGLGALLFTSITNVFSGLILAFMAGTLERLPGLIVLVPAAIGMRGKIFGALGSRLGTAIHTGEFETPISRRSVAGQGVLASMVLTLYTSAALAPLAQQTARLFGLRTISMLDFLVISLVGGVISSLIVLIITVRVAVVSVHRGWDMDNVAAPVVTAAGDLVTLPALWAASYLVGVPYVGEVLGVLTVVAIAATSWASLRSGGLDVFRQVVRQSIPVLIVAGLVDIVAGITVEHRLEDFTASPALFVLLPPFLADAGALGGILSARLASKLHLGLIAARGLPPRASLEDVFLTYLLGLPVFLLLGGGATLAAELSGLSHPPLGSMISLSFIAGILTLTGTVFVAYYSAVIAFHFGLDPDTYGIPAVTSTMDMMGVVVLLASMFFLGLA